MLLTITGYPATSGLFPPSECRSVCLVAVISACARAGKDTVEHCTEGPEWSPPSEEKIRTPRGAGGLG